MAKVEPHREKLEMGKLEILWVVGELKGQTSTTQTEPCQNRSEGLIIRNVKRED